MCMKQTTKHMHIHTRKHTQTGKRHKAYGVTPEQMKAFGQVFTDLIKKNFQGWNDEYEAAWKWFWEQINTFFENAMKEEKPIKN